MDKAEFKSFFLVAIYCLALGTSTLANGEEDSSTTQDADDCEANVCKVWNSMEDKVKKAKKCCNKSTKGIGTIVNGKQYSSKSEDADVCKAKVCKVYNCMEDMVQKANKSCKKCTSNEQTGVSVGVAVGLLFLGVAVGTIATALICVFVPSLHRKTDTIRRKVTRRFHNSLKEDRYQTAQELDQSVTDNRLDTETKICNPKVPTAPFGLPGLDQDGYQVLDAVDRARYSHAYTGLQSETFGQSPEIQPIKLPKAIISPVYREFTDNIVPSNERKTRQNAYSENQNSKEESQPIRDTITNDTANHEYFVLEPQNEAKNAVSCDNERPVSDHPYFVLEGQNAKNFQ